MTQIDDIRQTYDRLARDEADAATALEQAREDVKTAREADVDAFAEATLMDTDPPKRKEVRLRHTIENLEIAAEGYDLAMQRLLNDAVAAVGEGHRQLNAHEQQLLAQWMPPFMPGGRPNDLIDFVTEVYDGVDRRHDANEEARRKKEGYQEAIAAVQRAKGEHTRLGRDMRDFSMDRYPEIVTPELRQFLAKQPGRGQFQNQSQGNEMPWPGSIQDEASHGEVATPA